MPDASATEGGTRRSTTLISSDVGTRFDRRRYHGRRPTWRAGTGRRLDWGRSLSEDPHDFVASHLLHSGGRLGRGTTPFAVLHTTETPASAIEPLTRERRGR